MSAVLSDFSRSVTAEVFKLKRTPILWLSIIGGATSAIIVFLLFYVLIDEFVNFNQNPWIEYYQISHSILSTMLILPYIVLLCSTIVNQEHQSEAWKYLYALPVHKSAIYFSKLLTAIALLALTLFVFWGATLLGGYVLGFLRPEYEFGYFSATPLRWTNVIVHTFISALGVMALQYWLSVRWKNYIVPIGIGLMGFILSVLIVGEERIALYLPYCYPMFLSDRMDYPQQFNLDAELTQGLINAEWYSLILLAVFSVAGYIEQRVRDVT